MNGSHPCPCTSSLVYAACCGRYHLGEPAPNAQALMRSRYAAFVLWDEPYLLATWHPRTRPASVPFDRNQKWLGLKIVDAREKGTDLFSEKGTDRISARCPRKIDLSPFHAEVEFIARYRVGGGSAARLHERSRFVREDSRWFYVDGDLLR